VRSCACSKVEQNKTKPQIFHKKTEQRNQHLPNTKMVSASAEYVPRNGAFGWDDVWRILLCTRRANSFSFLGVRNADVREVLHNKRLATRLPALRFWKRGRCVLVHCLAIVHVWPQRLTSFASSATGRGVRVVSQHQKKKQT
jgi:hypothetical protein